MAKAKYLTQYPAILKEKAKKAGIKIKVEGKLWMDCHKKSAARNCTFIITSYHIKFKERLIEKRASRLFVSLLTHLIFTKKLLLSKAVLFQNCKLTFYFHPEVSLIHPV